MIKKYLALLISLFGIFWFVDGNSQMYENQGPDFEINAMVTSQGWGAGISVFDFNNDGLDDLTFSSNQPEHFFYINTGDGFELIDFGVSSIGGSAKQILWVDYDNDSDYDLFIAYYFGKVKLYQNQGDLSFIDVTEEAQLPSDIASNYGASFADVNRDGNLDLLICRYESWENPPEDPSQDSNRWSRFLLNTGNGSFVDATESSGIIMSPTPAFQGAFMDFNNDLWPDLHVIVDRAPGNHLFINEEGTYTELTNDLNVGFPENDFMSNSVADFNNDGYLDIFMTNTGSAVEYTPPYLLRNNDGQGFTNITGPIGLEIFDFAWGALWVDVDNDGWQDLFYTTPDYDGNHLYRNIQGQQFVDIYNEVQLASDYPCYTAGKGDFNNDGKNDIAVQAVFPNPPMLLMNIDNENQNNYVKISLEGTISNKMAIGSWVKIHEGEHTYHDYTMLGQNYISQSSQHMVFGLGEMDMVVDSITITYPSGHTDLYKNLPADSSYYFIEGETYEALISASSLSICEGESITLDAGNHSQYLWNNGQTTQVILVDTAGTYSVQVTNEFGVTTFADISIEVFPTPIIAETINPNPCNGDTLASIELQNLTTVEADSVIWNNGDEGIFVDSLMAGNYSYSFVDINGCSVTGEVEITDGPELLVFEDAIPSDPDENNGQINVTIFGGVPPFTIILEGDTVNTEIEGLAPGEYEVLIIDSYGCEIVINSIVESTLTTSQLNGDKIRVYPNPFENTFSIEGSADIESIQIFNILGEMMEVSQPLLSGQISMAAYPSGVYILSIRDKEQVVYTTRIFKQ